MADETQMVVFKLIGDNTVCEYGIPITQVQEIIPMAQPTRLPQTPDFVEGVINLRGRIIPIIDIKKRFNMGSSEITSETRSVVVDVENSTVGIIVDEVSEVLRLPASSIEPPPVVMGGITAEYLTGIGKLEDRLLVLLDMNKILNEGERAELAAIKDRR
ncbi:MAG: chemotaxis protein CheW [Syntrophomonadaceae bacterium]|jgi:purine-binding chemotaxis protein CheW